MKRIHLVIAFAAPIMVIGLLAVAGVRSTQLNQATDAVRIQLPRAWVPFTADIVRRAGQEGERSGTYYRSSDGSFAKVFTSPGGPSVFIQNSQTKRLYVRRVYEGREEWISFPIDPKDFWAMASPETELFARLTLLPNRLDGFEVYEMVSHNGNVSWFAPALNGFQVLMRSTTFEEQYHNIRIGEPPANVFVPPPGVEVRAESIPVPLIRSSKR